MSYILNIYANDVFPARSNHWGRKNSMSSTLITEYHYYKTLSSGILKPVIIMTTKTNKEKNFFVKLLSNRSKVYEANDGHLIVVIVAQVEIYEWTTKKQD
jgi:hypothetical protein